MAHTICKTDQGALASLRWWGIDEGFWGFAIIFVEVYNCFVELERVYEEKVYKI